MTRKVKIIWKQRWRDDAISGTAWPVLLSHCNDDDNDDHDKNDNYEMMPSPTLLSDNDDHDNNDDGDLSLWYSWTKPDQSRSQYHLPPYNNDNDDDN